MVWYSHLLKNFLQLIVIHTVKGFGIITKTEISDPPVSVQPEFPVNFTTL